LQIDQVGALRYLTGAIGYRIDAIAPAAATVLTLLAGKAGAPTADALTIVFANLGSFVPGDDGQLNAEASLSVLQAGLRTYLNGRVDTELVPLVATATADAPELQTYLDEVLLATLRTVVDTVFGAVLAWTSGGADTQRALRELCSSLLMRLFGRSLVVTGDVLLAHALQLLQAEFRQLAAVANDPGGIAPTLAAVTGLDRDLVADLVTETLGVCADTFGPMPDERRARMRDLMYQMIDTTPPDAGASTLDSLKGAGMVGNAQAAFELAQLLGAEIAGNLVRFVEALLTRVAATLLALLADAIADIQHAVLAWVQQIEGLARELITRLADLLHEINALQAQLDAAVDLLLAQASVMLGGFAGNAGSRGVLRGEIADAVKDCALDVLAGFPGYGLLPGGVRRDIRNVVRAAVDNALDDALFDDVVSVLVALSADTAAFVDDLRRIEPGDDLTGAIADIALDRIENALRGAFGGNPSLRIEAVVPVLGAIDLGRIELPITTFVAVARAGIRAIGRFDDAVAQAAGALARMLDVEADLEAAESEHRAVSATKDEADQRVAEIRDGALDLAIAHPQPASVITGAVTVSLRIPGGSAALLAADGLSHRRVFLWVNESEVALDTARVRTELPPSALSLPSLPATPLAGEGTGRAAHPSAQARAQRHDAQTRQALGLRVTPAASMRQPVAAAAVRPTGAGVVSRFAGLTLPPSPLTGGFPPRVAAAPRAATGADLHRPVLVVDIDVPEALLHEGINAIACTLVPGVEERRVERALSFLHVPPQPAAHRGATMPAPFAQPSMPAALARILELRGAAPIQAVRTLQAMQAVRGDTWVAPLSERRKTLARSLDKLHKELAVTADRHAQIRAAIAKGVLRPRRVALRRPPARMGVAR